MRARYMDAKSRNVTAMPGDAQNVAVIAGDARIYVARVVVMFGSDQQRSLGDTWQD